MWTLWLFLPRCPLRASSSSKLGRPLRIACSATKAPRVATHRSWRPPNPKTPQRSNLYFSLLTSQHPPIQVIINLMCQCVALNYVIDFIEAARILSTKADSFCFLTTLFLLCAWRAETYSVRLSGNTVESWNKKWTFWGARKQSWIS